MYIIPMSGITPIDAISQNNQTKSTESTGFSDIFKQALENVESTQKTAQEDSVKLALGEVDDLHTIQINMQKASLALETFVSMKNTAIGAYNEVMNMNI